MGQTRADILTHFANIVSAGKGTPEVVDAVISYASVFHAPYTEADITAVCAVVFTVMTRAAWVMDLHASAALSALALAQEVCMYSSSRQLPDCVALFKACDLGNTVRQQCEDGAFGKLHGASCAGTLREHRYTT